MSWRWRSSCSTWISSLRACVHREPDDSGCCGGDFLTRCRGSSSAGVAWAASGGSSASGAGAAGDVSSAAGAGGVGDGGIMSRVASRSEPKDSGGTCGAAGHHPRQVGLAEGGGSWSVKGGRTSSAEKGRSLSVAGGAGSGDSAIFTSICRGGGGDRADQ